eukprot:2467734-Pyramimonas_sp.AAC.1
MPSRTATKSRELDAQVDAVLDEQTASARGKRRPPSARAPAPRPPPRTSRGPTSRNSRPPPPTSE